MPHDHNTSENPAPHTAGSLHEGWRFVDTSTCDTVYPTHRDPLPASTARAPMQVLIERHAARLAAEAIAAAAAVPAPGRHEWKTEIQFVGFDLEVMVGYDIETDSGDSYPVVRSVRLGAAEILPALSRAVVGELEEHCRDAFADFNS